MRIDPPFAGSTGAATGELLIAPVYASHLAVIAINKDGGIARWSPAAERMFGWLEAELMGLPNPVLPVDSLKFVEMRESGAAECSPIRREIVRKDGSTITVVLQSTAIRDSAGGPSGWITIVEDITRKTEIERALHSAEERFTKAFNFSPWPMAINAITDGRFIDVNDRLLEDLGVLAEDIVGKTPMELGIDSAPADKERIQAAIAATGSFPPTIIDILEEGGGIRSILFSAELIEIDGAQCLLSTFEDTTGKRRAEAEQARLQAEVQKAALEWRLTFDAVDYQILLLDFSGRVLRLNRLAKETAGKGYWQIKGKPVESISPGQPWQRAAEMVRSVAKSRSNISCHVRDAAAAKAWDLTASIVAGPGERIILVARDITATVELQETLRKNETMSAMGALVAGVAHEVRNPLFSISATLDAFEARFGEQAEYRPYITVLRGELDRLNQLMQDLLEYGRPSVLEASKGSISDAIKQALASCSTIASAAGVELIDHSEERLPLVMMDRRRIIQVFHNLIVNAVQHSRAGQRVIVEVAARPLGDSAWIDCTVADSGTGFTLEDLPRIFEPFFTRRRGGTGLGLSIVQRIVEEHDGQITASNRPSGGAIVKVSFKGAGE